MTALQICAAAVAILGAWLVRKPGRWMRYGFVAWLVSNPLAMVFMAINGFWWLFAQNLVFFALAVEGAWHWLVKPALDQTQENLHVDVE